MAPLLTGHKAEQARISNPRLNFLRDVALALKKESGLGESYHPSDIVSVCRSLPPVRSIRSKGAKTSGSSTAPGPSTAPGAQTAQREGRLIIHTVVEAHAPGFWHSGISIKRPSLPKLDGAGKYALKKLFLFALCCAAEWAGSQVVGVSVAVCRAAA